MADQQNNMEPPSDIAQRSNVGAPSDTALLNVAAVLGNVNVTLVDLRKAVEELSKKIDRLTTQLEKRE